MTISAEQVRPFLRVSGTAFDDEISLYIDAAVRDMTRVGIDEDLFDEDDALATTAIICYCKSRFGFDNPDSTRYEELYRQMVTDLLNSQANIAAAEESEDALG